MRANAIDRYVEELRQVLEQTLSTAHAEEIAAEARSHLYERVSELSLGGVGTTEAESLAIREFGSISELSSELAEGYPPKSPFDPDRLRYLPELAVTVMLLLGGYAYSIYGGQRGVESAAGILIPSTPMLVVPGMCAGLARLKYRRLRPIAVTSRMAHYGLGLTILSTVGLLGLQLTGRATLRSLFGMYYAFAIVTCFMYAIMRLAYSDGKAYRFLTRRLHKR